MIGLEVAIVLAVFIALAILGPKYGADTRPRVQDPPEAWFRHRS